MILFYLDFNSIDTIVCTVQYQYKKPKNTGIQFKKNYQTGCIVQKKKNIQGYKIKMTIGYFTYHN